MHSLPTTTPPGAHNTWELGWLLGWLLGWELGQDKHEEEPAAEEDCGGHGLQTVALPSENWLGGQM